MRTGSVNAPSSELSEQSQHAAARDTESVVDKGLQISKLPVTNGIYRIRALEEFRGLLHGISTRAAPDGEDWNLSARRGTSQHPPSLENAQANRQKLASALGIPFECVVGCQQVHGAEVALVGHTAAGELLPHASYVPGVDALVTDTPGQYLMALAADCPTVFFYDPVQRAIGLAHSGWKGTVSRISANVVRAMIENFGTSPSDIVAAVGPGIGPCCYAVGMNVTDAVEEAFPEPYAVGLSLLQAREGQVYFNLREAIRRTLSDAGVRPENITIDGVCTAHNTHIFYSHRAEAGECGLFGAIFGMI